VPASHTSAALVGGLLPRPGSSSSIPPRRLTLPPRIRTAYSGFGHISGTVLVKGTPDAPTVRNVRLHRQLDGVAVAERFSAADGTYSFDHIDATLRYHVVAFDYEHNFRAVIADNLTPDPMP